MKVICFDLDDTLYKEIDYLRAAYKNIAESLWGPEWLKWYQNMLAWYRSGDDVFARICDIREDIEIVYLLNMYRFSLPNLLLPTDTEEILGALKSSGAILGLISDGRAITQENKIKALSLDQYFSKDLIVISEVFGSEKPCENNYQYFMDRFPESESFSYVADNPQKDFIAANKLGWNTICLLDDGRNIHKQDFSLPEEYLPKVRIRRLKDLKIHCL